MQVVVMSDSHGKDSRLTEAKQQYPNADYYIHCGDIESQLTDTDFQIVAGNNDYFCDYPSERIIEAGSHRILVMHGHQFPYVNREKRMAAYAKEQGCDIFCFGHTHVAMMKRIDDVVLINPGSCWRSRDGKGPSFAVLEIEDKIQGKIIFFEK